MPGGLFHLQGDIVAILDSNGTAVVQYKYDAWGRQIDCTFETGNDETEALSTLNPFRYRGYVYDEETGLYYLRRIDTEAPQLTLYIPPYVTEHLDPNLLDVLVSESIITFRIAIEDKDVALSGNPAMLYSLSTNESSVFSLSEHNTYMSSYVQPMRIIGSVLCGSSLCVMICCLISILRKRKRTCGC